MRFAANFLWILGISISALSVNVPSVDAQGKRQALVIGNSEYRHAPRLENPKNDATDIAASLERLGFHVTKGLDLDKASMEQAIRQFAEALSGAEAALLFYAGHGLQVSGQNYLVPIDAKLTSAAGLDFELIRLDLIHRTMEREVNTNIIFLDACRDNPLARNLARALGTRSIQIGRGLAGVESGEGTLISFSTQPGNVALDGAGRNSPFASALIAHMGTPGADIQTMLINVRRDVIAATERRQVPWEHSALTARFFLANPSPGLPPAPSASSEHAVEIAVWDSIKGSSDPSVLRSYLTRYPTGLFAVVANNLIAALEKQQELEKAVRESELKREQETRKAQESDLRAAREALRKAQEAAKSAGSADEARRRNGARSAQDTGVAKSDGGFRTCGRNGCQWVPAGCRAIPNAGGGGLGGKIVCP